MKLSELHRRERDYAMYDELFDVDEFDTVGTAEIVEHDNMMLAGVVNWKGEMRAYRAGDLTDEDTFRALIAADSDMSFQEGDCYILASELQALENVTGFAHIICQDTGDMMHAVAVTEQNTLLDSLGVWTDSELEAYWDTMSEEWGTSGVELQYMMDDDGVEVGDGERSALFHILRGISETVS